MPSRPTTDQELRRVLDALAKAGGSVRKAAHKLDLGESTVRRHLWLARERGMVAGVMPTVHVPETESVTQPPDKPQRITFPPAFASGGLPIYYSRPDNSYVFGACGDSHLGSKYERMDVLDDLYDRFAAAGVDRVFHTGNWIDGYKHGLNEHDVHTPHMEGQLRYLAQAYPQRPGIVTYAVAGEDHEGWWARMHGIDIGKRAEQTMREHGRTDWVDLGFMESHVRLVNSNTGAEAIMAVVHPGGGTAYALSYQVQKIIESLEGGEKPAVALYGHYHKLIKMNVRNVWCFMTGCFLGATSIQTDSGPKKIKDIRVGDMVRTHKNRYRPVTNLFKKSYSGDFITINYGLKGSLRTSLTSTAEHPFLIERDGVREWLPAMFVRPGDMVFVSPRECSITSEPIPFFMRMGKNGNPMHRAESRDKLSATKGGKVRVRGGSAGESHLHKDVIPFCRKMEEDGWKMVPVGGQVIPDAIGYKDGRLVAFEIEKSSGRLREFKVQKYQGAEISEFIDDVVWEYLDQPKEQPRSFYEFDAETGLVKVLVRDVQRKPISGARNRKTVTVYNFSVEEDESYIAGRVAVHNCTQDQTIFMRNKVRQETHVGGLIIALEQDPQTGAIVGAGDKMLRYFGKSYGNNRWNKAGSVNLPVRGL